MSQTQIEAALCELFDARNQLYRDRDKALELEHFVQVENIKHTIRGVHIAIDIVQKHHHL